MAPLKRVIAVLPVGVLLAPYLLLAQNTRLPDRIVPCNGVDCTCEHLIQLAQNLINGGIFLAVFFSAMLFAYAGWLYISNEAIGEQQRAKSIFSKVATGLIIILVAWLVVDTLMAQLLRDNVTWNNFCQSLDL